jgi:hypothetical protein
MTRETLTLLAKRHLGYISLSAFVNWAVFMLEAGYDTEHLRILSSLGSDPAHADIDHYFGQTLHELGWAVPPVPLLLRLYAQVIAQDMLEGEATPVEGCRIIYRIFLDDPLNDPWDRYYPIDMLAWLYLDEGLDPGTYQDLEGESLNKAIRQEARRLLKTLEL